MNLTIIICARDAESTIERAVATVLRETQCRLLLVDDGCRDSTVSRALALSEGRLQVVSTVSPGGIPQARQMGLDACDTEYAAWLDADDEWISGRANRIVEALENGADVYSEAIDLVDGESGSILRRLEVPVFVRMESNPARLFERNYLPGDSQLGFRVAAFREAGGYDPETFGAESFDILLRAIARGANFAFGDKVGYRMVAYPNSVSRNLMRQRASLANALKKHDYEAVRGLCVQAGQPERVAAWVLVSMAVFRGEMQVALRFLDEASPVDADPDEVLEPNGPVPLCEGWRRAFQRGTCLALLGGRDDEAEAELGRAAYLKGSAEVLNNRGVVFARMGRIAEANACWMEALRVYPGYADAKQNLYNPQIGCITTHPLRRQPSRSEYG